MKKILDTLERVIVLVCAVLFIGIMFLIAAQVLSRYMLNNPLTWSEHAARALFIWMIMLYAGVLVRNNGNIGFDLVAKSLPKWIGDLLAILCDGMIFVFSAYWCFNAGKLCESLSKLRFADLKLPYNAIYYAEPVGAAIVCLFCAEVIVLKVIALKKDWREKKC